MLVSSNIIGHLYTTSQDIDYFDILRSLFLDEIQVYYVQATPYKSPPSLSAH
jgi:hypothetical protein